MSATPAADPPASSAAPKPADAQGSAPPPASASAGQQPYVVIARKWRPQTFKDLVGQDDIAAQLRSMIDQNRIGQAFLFCGPRGVGKTSSARLLACALNCVGGPSADFDPDDPICREIRAGQDMDVLEIDGASNNSVENIRDLRSKVNIAPMRDRYKVYIIDEVHMLSGSAFNALLKTLEEPPPQVKFILATTERHKIPETILSRCQPFDFNRLDTRAIADRLDYIIANEPAIGIEEEHRREILELIAISSDGGLRDSQMSLDQLVSLGNGTATLDNALRLLGLVESGMFEDVVANVLARDCKALLATVSELSRRGRDIERFVKNLLSYVRDILLMKGGADPRDTGLEGARYERARERFFDASIEQLLNLMQTLVDLEPRLKGTVPARFLLEFAFIKLAALEPVSSIAALIERLEESEKKR